MAFLDTLGWSQRIPIRINSALVPSNQADFVLYLSHKLGGNDMTKVIPFSFYIGIARASTDGKDIRLTSDIDGNTELPLDLISFNLNIETGTTTSTTAFKLNQTGQNFLSTVKVGDRVFNTTDSTTALVTVVNSNTQLTLDADIMASGEAYQIVRFYFATNKSITTGVDVTIYLWCGNSNATLPAVNSTYGRNNVYLSVGNPYLANWHLNEASATDAIDSTGHGWTGTSAGTSGPASSPGIFYQGQYFDSGGAVPDRYNIPGTTTSPWEGNGQTPSGAFTVAGWINRDGTTGIAKVILGKRNPAGTTKGYEIHLMNTNILEIVMDFGDSQINFTGTTVFTDGVWYHVAFVIPENGLPTSYKIYVNGVSEGTAAISGTTVDSGTTNGATTAFKLIQSGQNFLSTCSARDIVKNTVSNAYALVTSVDSNTQLTLSVDIMLTGQTFQVYGSSSMDIPQTVGIGSQEGTSSARPFKGTMENIVYINGKEMTADWAVTQYNSISSVPTFYTSGAGTLFNQFPADWNLLFRLHIVSQPVAISGTVTNYVNLLDETSVNNTFWNIAQNGGGNIRIATNSDGTGILPIDVALLDTVLKKLEIWFLKDVTAAGGASIYLFYKTTNENLAYQPHVDNTNGRNSVWSPMSFKLVTHLEESATPGTTTAADFYLDSTGTGNDGQATKAPMRDDGIAQYGQKGNGIDQEILIGNSQFMTGGQSGTMSAWAQFDGSTNENTPWGYGNDANGERRILQQRQQGIGGHISNGFWGVPNHYNGWTYLVWVFPIQANLRLINTKIYINAVEMVTTNPDNNFKLQILAGFDQQLNTVYNVSKICRGTNGAFSDVPMDECRLSTQVLSQDWITLDYLSQSDPSSVWVLDDSGLPWKGWKKDGLVWLNRTRWGENE